MGMIYTLIPTDQLEFEVLLRQKSTALREPMIGDDETSSTGGVNWTVVTKVER
jgi:hypothetical protein